jgi:hypothetical protein
MSQKFSQEQRLAILRAARARAQSISPIEECFREYEERQAERAALGKIAQECESALRDNAQN